MAPKGSASLRQPGRGSGGQLSIHRQVGRDGVPPSDCDGTLRCRVPGGHAHGAPVERAGECPAVRSWPRGGRRHHRSVLLVRRTGSRICNTALAAAAIARLTADVLEALPTAYPALHRRELPVCRVRDGRALSVQLCAGGGGSCERSRMGLAGEAPSSGQSSRIEHRLIDRID